MTDAIGGRAGLLACTVAAVGVGGLVVVKPLYVAVLLGGVLFIAALALDPALGLALFTQLVFFGELGHGASPAKAVGALLVLFWALQLIRRDRRTPFLGWARPQIFFLALGIVVWAVLSMLWARDPGVASSTALRLALNVMLFLVVPTFATTKRDVMLVLRAYVFGAVATAVYGIASGNTQTDATGRLAGGIGDPNELAAFLIPAIVLGLFLLPLSRTILVRAGLLLSVGISLLALILTQSRGGVVALSAAGFAAILWGGRYRGRAVFAVCAAVAGVAAYMATTSLALGRFSSFGGGGSGRTDIWRVALRVFRANPIDGVGIGNFPVVEPQFAAGNLNLPRVDLVVDTQRVAHNTYLNVLADLGLIGFALFAALLVAVLIALHRRLREAVAERDAELELIARAVLIALVGLLVAFMFISAQYEKQLWLLLGMGLAVANLRKATEPAEEPPPPLGVRVRERPEPLVGV